MQPTGCRIKLGDDPVPDPVHEWRRPQECATLFPAMADQTSLIVLRYVNKTPSLASCAKCQRKFFTPNTYYNDPVSADQYLRDKFELHDCSEEPKADKARWIFQFASRSVAKPDQKPIVLKPLNANSPPVRELGITRRRYG